MLRGVAHKHAAALALAALAACMLGGWRLRSGRGDELVGPTPAQFAAQLQAGALSQAGYLTDSEHPAGLIASEAGTGGRLWARARAGAAENSALSALEQRAQTQAAEIARRRRGERIPHYQSVEESALASIAAQARQQLSAAAERKAQNRRRPADDPIRARQAMTPVMPGKVQHRASADVTKLATVHATELAQEKVHVKSLAKVRAAERRKQLARIALLDDDRTASRRLKKQKSQILRLVEAASKQSGGEKRSADSSSRSGKGVVGSKLLWPGENEKGMKRVLSAGRNGKQHAPGSTPAAPKEQHEAHAASKVGDQSLSWPGEADQSIKWPGERGYAKPAHAASQGKGDRLAWPDGHGADATPLHPGPNAATQAGWHGGGWKDLNTEWSWPQEGAAPVSEGVGSQLNLVLLIDGATRKTMTTREQGIFEAAVADAAGVSLQQLHVDYAVDVPGLLGHMEVSLRMMLSPGVSCGAVAANVRQAVQGGKLNSMLADFGASGLAVSLLNMSGCPAAMMPAPAPLPTQADSAPQLVGPTGGDDEERRHHHPAARGRAGLTSSEAVEAAEQVATQTAQQVASEVATASAADTAKQLEGELRTLAQKVAKATATKVARDILDGSAAGRSHKLHARPSALKQLEAAAARHAARRYGP